jgi:HlyD family secretion protein
MDVAVNPARVPDSMDRPLRQPWWQQPRWRRLMIAGVALLLLLAAVVVLLGPAQRTLRMTRTGVSIAMVEQGLYHDFIPLRGEVVPHDTVYLDALEGGLVARVLAQAGDWVKAGQPLAEFSNTALELEVRGSENGLVQSITSLQKLETELEMTRANNERLLADTEDDVTRLQRELGRREQLVLRNVISVEERDQYKDQLASALRRRDNKLKNLVARAPVAGQITVMDLKVGENHGRGDRLAEITPDTGFKLSARVDEYYLGRVRAGQSGSVGRDARDWSLQVTRVSPQVKDGAFTVDLAFAGAAPAGLLRGQSLQGRLSLGEDQPGLVLASGAFLEASGGDWVFVLDADGRAAHRRRVKLGRRNAEQVEVLSGLSAGERVIVSDYTGLDRIDRIDLG